MEGQQNDDNQIQTRGRCEIEPETETDQGYQCESNAAGQALSDRTPASIVLVIQHDIRIFAFSCVHVFVLVVVNTPLLSRARAGSPEH